MLRRPERPDLEAFVRMCADPQVMRFIATGRPLERVSAELAFEVMLAQWHDRGFGLRSAVEPATGEYLGFVGLAVRPAGGLAAGETEIGWRLCRAAWGRGLATEGAVAVRDADAFGALALASLVAVARPANRASRRVMEKLGMTLADDRGSSNGLPAVTYRLAAPARLHLGCRP